MKFSLYDPISSIQNYATILVHQAGKVYQITKTNLLSNYYNKTEINTMLASITSGGTPVAPYVEEDLAIGLNASLVISHNLGSLDVDYVCFEWNSTAGQYLQMQSALREVDRDESSVTLYSTRAIAKFKIKVNPL